jgi:hypothetical protein
MSCVYLRWITRATLLAVRWERLFDDFEAQLDAADREEFAGEVADRTRREVALVHLLDRLRHALGASVELGVDGAGPLCGVIRRVGPGWLLLDVAAQPEVVVSVPAVRTVRGLPVAAADVEGLGLLESRLDLGHVLRVIARDRSPVAVVLRDGSRWTGTLDRVGADFVDLAEHAIGEPRRAGNVSAVRTLAFAGVAVVRPGC